MAKDAFNESHEAARSLVWPSVIGEVEDVRVKKHEHHSRYSTWYDYEPIIGYEYEFDATRYRDTRIGWYETRYSEHAEAQHFIDQNYQPGKKVKVFYDTSHPHHACLITGHASKERIQGIIRISFALLFICMGIAIVVYCIKHGWSTRSS